MAYTLFSKQNLLDACYTALEESYFKELVDKTPKKTGELAMNWELVKKNKKVIAINLNGDLITWLEFGTKPYVIKPKDKTALHWEVGGEHFFAKEVHHPGIKARKFIRKVLQSKRNYNKFEKVFEREIAKVMSDNIKLF